MPLTQFRILYERNDTWRTNYDYTVGPTMVLHVGVGYIRYRNPDVMRGRRHELRRRRPARTERLRARLLRAFPGSPGLSGNQGGMGLSMGPTNGNLYFEDKPTANASLTYIRGNHSFKLGADWRIDVWTNRAYIQAIGNYTFGTAQTGLPSTQASPLTGGSVGFAYASFLLGMADSATCRSARRSAIPQDLVVAVPSGHLESHPQTDAGLRPSLGPGMPAREIHNRWSPCSPRSPQSRPQAGCPAPPSTRVNGPSRCNCQFTDKYPYAIGPRIGVAYQFTPKTVLRGGWGFAYTRRQSVRLSGSTALLGTGWNTLNFQS